MDYKSTDKNLKIKRLDTKTAALYIRVSSQDQVNNFSIPTQLKECRDYLSKRGLTEVGLFIEKGESAKTSNRTEFLNLMYFLSHNKAKVDHVVFYKVDRWARNQNDYHYYKAKIREYGTSLLSVTEQIDESPQGKFLEGVYAALAQLDNENKGERVKQCMTTKALDGWYPTKSPYGYKNDKDTKRLVRDARYFDHISFALKEFARGLTIPEIVRMLKTRGVKTWGRRNTEPRYLTAKDIWAILDSSKFYAGVYDWKEHKDIEGKHERMITWTEHLKIQERLHTKPTKIVRDEKETFILNFTIEKAKGFLHCSECGERMRSCKSKGKGGEYLYYYCKNPLCSATKKSEDKELLESKFQDNLKTIAPTSTFVDLFNELMVEEWHYMSESTTNISKDINNKLKQLEFEKKETIAMRRRRELDENDFNSEMVRIKSELNNLTLSSTNELPSLIEFKKLLNSSGTFLKNVEPLYNDYPISKKREMAQILFPKGVLFGNGVLRTPTKSYLLEVFDVLESGNVDKLTLQRIEL